MYYAIITKQNKIINNKTCLCCCNFITWCSFPPNCSHTKITFNCYFLKFLIKQWALRCQLRSELWSAVSRPAKDPRQTELSAATWPGHTWPPASPPLIGQQEVTLGNMASLLVSTIFCKIRSAIYTSTSRHQLNFYNWNYIWRILVLDIFSNHIIWK